LAEVVQEANKGRSEADRCLLILDGVHGFGCSDEDVAALGADFLAASTHKWIFGPRGTGLVWGRADAWPHIRPTVPSFDSLVPIGRWMADQPPDPRTQAAFVSPGGFCAFEHCWGVEAAFELHERLGRERVTARVAELNGRFCTELAAMKNVTLHTPLDPKLRAGIVCLEVKGLKTEETVARLRLAEAALARLDELADDDCAADDAIDRARASLQARIGRARARIDGDQPPEPGGLTDRDLRRALNAAEHAELARLYDDGTISQPTRLQLQRGLDLEATRLSDEHH
jgi:selenocysteine lyase/cysteine desulfurase